MSLLGHVIGVAPRKAGKRRKRKRRKGEKVTGEEISERSWGTLIISSL